MATLKCAVLKTCCHIGVCTAILKIVDGFNPGKSGCHQIKIKKFFHSVSLLNIWDPKWHLVRCNNNNNHSNGKQKQCIILKGFLTHSHNLEKNHFVFTHKHNYKMFTWLMEQKIPPLKIRNLLPDGLPFVPFPRKFWILWKKTSFYLT